ncbi:DUF6707 family protein [Chryseobacterium sp. NFX27]|uniref:DUF6707 family protein n=1 Tax=Chryseobacterium sp. NFX27 TaxID=2819618 RepID=UPI003CF1B5E3
MENTFEKIRQTFENKKPFIYIFQHFEKTDLNDPETLKNLMMAAYSYYFLEDLNSMNEIFAISSQLEFDGDYNKWTWVEGIIVLKLFIDNFKNEELKQKILDTLDYGNDESINKIKNKAFQRRLLGQLLNKNKVEEAENKNDENLIVASIIPYLKELFFIRSFKELVKSENDNLESEISENILKVKKFLKNY